MRLLLAAPLLVLACGHALRSQTACCSWLPCCAGTNEGSGRLSHNEIRYCLPQTGLSSTMGDLITAPAAHVEARSQNAGLVITRTISTRRDDAHRTSPTLTPSAGASSELASRHSHLPVGRALEEQLLLPPAARVVVGVEHRPRSRSLSGSGAGKDAKGADQARRLAGLEQRRTRRGRAFLA